MGHEKIINLGASDGKNKRGKGRCFSSTERRRVRGQSGFGRKEGESNLFIFPRIYILFGEKVDVWHDAEGNLGVCGFFDEVNIS